MSETRATEWLYKLNDEENVAYSRSELIQLLNRAEGMSSGRLWLGVDGGLRPWWHRLLGSQPRYVDALLSVEWADDYASLIFHDESWSEYRAVDREAPVKPSEEIKLKISHGEMKPHPAEECMQRDRAFKAIRELLDSHVRPAWLSYRFVK